MFMRKTAESENGKFQKWWVVDFSTLKIFFLTFFHARQLFVLCFMTNDEKSNQQSFKSLTICVLSKSSEKRAIKSLTKFKKIRYKNFHDFSFPSR